ncbi:protein dj-1beta-like isoform X2 [Anthonomus grandis grandis]|uniref:protein dj-1beta-like isoform X2 n=1 Tax=Anthonomus grandis grandis TaxID=2921223 RepID=UPI0021650DD7|nr:protein dj-1beta-like isoform X2 [Anthonomus grandis grandis]
MSGYVDKRLSSCYAGARRKQIYCQYSNSTMAKKALVFLGPGAEEMEFVISVDVLRRGGMDVTIAGLPDNKLVKGAHDIEIKPDIGVSDASSKGPFDVLVLPGGLGGSQAMASSSVVGQLLKDQEKAGRWIAAICAAPTALKAHGIADGKNVTCYPAMRGQMEEGGKYKYKEEKVVVDSNIITSMGPGTAFDFGLAIVNNVVGKDKAAEVAKAMLLPY